ncbi:enoyl-CoA hydratase/isomerase family protein [Pseudofrankia sp. BMG5.36]|uniref:enoyl-CoA hydratase/isomerase family protein n=1 Tax=Pseudofrankia sp. BMG5.36 TaxID=1834512 RepID=UPI000B2F108E|nr:enoyl-CoA hydratase/isomerase family protein [Pseudofrankia sp. BMG5.36]
MPAAATMAAAGLGLAVAGSCATVTFSPPAGRRPAGDQPAGDQPAGGLPATHDLITDSPITDDPDAAVQLPSVAAALAAVGRALPGDIRVVVLRGDIWSALRTPDRAALNGADLAPDAVERRVAEWQAGFTWLSARADLVSVAVAAGPVSGAGLQLALSCDLRVLTEDAVLSLPEASLGLVPGLGVTAMLVTLVGYPTALDLCLTGRRLTAAEARAAGLAQRVVPRAGLDAAVDDLVAALLAAPREAAAEAKALLRAAATGRGRDGALAAERAALARCLAGYPAG